MKSTSVILSTSAFLALMLAATGMMLILASNAQQTELSSPVPVTNTPAIVAQAATSTNTLPSVLSPQPSNTLRPAPTFEPPTSTPPPSPLLQATASPTLGINVKLPDLHGLESPTPTMDACEPRKDWDLTYTVKEGDALARIAQAYGTYTNDLASGNCLGDANMIRVGQTLRVPGEAHPAVPEWTCTAWEVLTPIDRAFDIAEDGQMTFNWRGSAGKRNLIRVFSADGSTFWERTIDLRQNETINLAAEGFTPGNYSWQIYPLDLNFAQIPCSESPVWHFNIGTRPKGQSAAP